MSQKFEFNLNRGKVQRYLVRTVCGSGRVKFPNVPYVYDKITRPLPQMVLTVFFLKQTQK